MTMSKRHLTIVGIGLSLVALVLLLSVIRPGDQVVNGTRVRQEEGAAAEEITVTRFPAETSHNVAVRTAIERKGDVFHDEAGIRTCLCPEYNPESPLIEIRNRTAKCIFS